MAERAATTTRTVVQLGSCAALAAFLLVWTWVSASGWVQCAALWVALSLLVGPLAPSSATAGPCTVGVGPPIPSPPSSLPSPVPHPARRRQKDALPIRPPSPPREPIYEEDDDADADEDDGRESVDSSGTDDDRNKQDLDEYMNYWLQHDDNSGVHKASSTKEQESTSISAPQPSSEWTPQDSDLLKKLMLKHPHGKLRRWEIIAEAFQGKYSVDLIIKMSKNLGNRGEGDEGDGSYAQFLAKRKVSERVISSPLTQRWDGDQSGMALSEESIRCSEQKSSLNNEGGGRKDWTEGDDKALLNALKAFPKDIPMRWEKVALAVPGKSKQQCFRRYAELRDGFRSKQAAT